MEQAALSSSSTVGSKDDRERVLIRFPIRSW